MSATDRRAQLIDVGRAVFAANGYVVVAGNPRGSSGRGEAFSAAISADWGNKDTQDVLALVDHAIAAGIADPERLGVGGWSYGGILTNYVIASDSRFKAATSGARPGLPSALIALVAGTAVHAGLQWAAPALALGPAVGPVPMALPEPLALAPLFTAAGMPLLRTARSGRPIIAIDGCPLHCVKGCLAQHDVKPDVHLTLSEFGVRKRYGEECNESVADALFAEIRDVLGEGKQAVA